MSSSSLCPVFTATSSGPEPILHHRRRSQIEPKPR
jgi:hypothetical protein